MNLGPQQSELRMELDYFLNFLHRLSTEKRITPKIGRQIGVLNSLCLKVSAGFNNIISELYKTIKNEFKPIQAKKA